MKVELSSVGNPDFGQDPNRKMYDCEPNKKVEVDSFEKASLLCSQFINKNELGGGNWSGGLITEGRKKLAYVSYNGRVWKIDKDKPMYSGKCVEIALDPKKVDAAITVFTHIKTTEKQKSNGDKYATFEYVDQHGRKFVYESTSTPWEYVMLRPTHEDFHSGSILELFADKCDTQALRKVDHTGAKVPDGTLEERHNAAVKIVEIVI